MLERNPDALVMAIGVDSRPVPMPASLELDDRIQLLARSGLELVAPEDQLSVIEAWERVFVEPVVQLEVHMQAYPSRTATVYIFDLREEHGVHLLIVDADDPELIVELVASHAGRARPIAHVKKDAVSIILDADAATTTLLGWTADQLIGHRTVEFVHPEDVQRAIDSWMEMRNGTSGRVRLRYRHANGSYVWLEITNHNHLDEPDMRCIVSEMADISEEMAHLEALRDRERLLARLAEALPIGVCHLRLDLEVVYANEPLVALLGPVDSIEALVDCIAESDRPTFKIALGHALEGRPSNLEVGVVNGREERRCEMTFRTLTNDDDGNRIDGVIVCAADVTDRTRLRSELEHRASHDALSGCLNRAATVAALERALREFEQVVVAYIDLDRFKATNDELGHAAGDELLRVAAARIRTATRVRRRRRAHRRRRVRGDLPVAQCVGRCRLARRASPHRDLRRRHVRQAADPARGQRRRRRVGPRRAGRRSGADPSGLRDVRGEASHPGAHHQPPRHRLSLRRRSRVWRSGSSRRGGPWALPSPPGGRGR